MAVHPEPEPDVQTSIELLRQAQGGDLSAYERLFERYHDRVLGIVRLRLGPKLRAVLESGDLVNDAMLEAFKGFDRFEIRESRRLTGYFATIVENCIRRAAEHHGAQMRDRDREVALEHICRSIASGSICFEPAAEGELPLDVLERGEQLRLMESCLEELTPEQRGVLLSRNTGDTSWAAVAAQLGLPTAEAARARYGRALIALASVLRRRFSNP